MPVPIAQLNTTCRFQLLKPSKLPGRYDWHECGAPATSAVYEPSPHFTGLSWRCDRHRGQVRLGVSAEIIETADRGDFLRYVP